MEVHGHVSWLRIVKKFHGIVAYDGSILGFMYQSPYKWLWNWNIIMQDDQGLLTLRGINAMEKCQE